MPGGGSEAESRREADRDDSPGRIVSLSLTALSEVPTEACCRRTVSCLNTEPSHPLQQQTYDSSSPLRRILVLLALLRK